LKTGAVGSLCFLRYRAVHDEQHSWQSINLPNTPYANLQKLEQRIVQRGGYVRYTSIQVSITQISLEPCHGGTDRVPVFDHATQKIESNVVSHGPWVRLAEAVHRYPHF
jgi:hypothetical protein